MKPGVLKRVCSSIAEGIAAVLQLDELVAGSDGTMPDVEEREEDMVEGRRKSTWE